MLPDVKGPAPTFNDGRTVLCYRVARANSATQPFVLQQLTESEIPGSGFYRPCGDDNRGETDSQGQRACRGSTTHHWTACSTLKRPLLGGQILVIGVDLSDLGETGVNVNQLKALNINVTNQQGSAMNPSPLRPSFPASASAGGGGGQAGSPGTATDSSGRGDWWVPIGTHQPGGTLPQRWMAETPYPQGAVVSDASGTHYFVAKGKDNKGFTSGLKPFDPFPPQPRGERILDGTVIWQEAGEFEKDKSTSERPKVPPDSRLWRENEPDIKIGNVVCVVRNGITDQISGSAAEAVTLSDSELKDLAITITTTRDLITHPSNFTSQQSLDLEAISKSLNDVLIQFSPRKPEPDLNTCEERQEELDAQVLVKKEDRKRIADELRAQSERLKGPDNAHDVLQKLKELVEGSDQNLKQALKGPLARLSRLLESSEAGWSLESLSTTLREEKRPGAPDVATEGGNKLAKLAAGRAQRAAELLRGVAATLEAEKPHLHYYVAVRAGVSGAPPLDPLSIMTIPRAIYLAWPYQLPGDVLPTFTVNMIYTPPTPGAPWQGNTFYPAGSVITSSANNGRYYTALTGGFSSTEPNEPLLPVDVPPTTDDGDLVWLDAGANAPNVSAAGGQQGGGQGAGGGGASGGGNQGGGGNQAGGGNQSGGNPTAGKAQQWMARSHYQLGDTIVDPYNGHYYTMVRSRGGTSGQPPNGQQDPFPQATPSPTLRDGELLWMDQGLSADNAPLWRSGYYTLGDTFVANGKMYKVVGFSATAGNSAADPFSRVDPSGNQEISKTVPDHELTWSNCATKPRESPCKPPGAWKSESLFDKDDVVKAANGRSYYVSQVSDGSKSGKSGKAPSPFEGLAPAPNGRIPDGQIEWQDSGSSGGGADWVAGKKYALGDTVTANNHLYVMVAAAGGSTGDTMPVIPGKPSAISDGDLVWMDVEGPCKPNGSWQSNTSYVLNFVVRSAHGCYKVIRFIAGMSGGEPTSPFPRKAAGDNLPPNPSTVVDGSVVWKSVTGPDQDGAKKWQQGAPFEENDIVHAEDDPTHYWKAIQRGISGQIPAQPPFGMTQPSTVAESQHPICDGGTGEKCDGGVQWLDSGIVRPIGLAGPVPLWAANYSKYNARDVIFVPGIGMGNGRYYTALTEGTTAAHMPDEFRSPTLPITWQDSGVTAPPSVASGQPADQNVALENLTLPQTHSLSYFNISTGAVFGFNRFANFGFVPANTLKLPSNLTAGQIPTSKPTSMLAVDPVTGCTIDAPQNPPPAQATTTNAYYCPGQVGLGAHTVDPVLVLTVYFPPVDAETPWRLTRRGPDWWRDLIPAPSVGLSLANPTTNFYIGGSMEVGIRNIQVFGGWAFLKMPTRLGAPATQPIWNGTGTVPAVSTVSGFARSPFVGVTYNLSGFIQSLFGGGGAAKGQ
jgi:uncharacterized membrane protein YgcG